MSRYKIEVTEITTETTHCGKTWQLGAGDTPNDFGYTPEIEKTIDVTRTVYTQSVEEIDLKAVIEAVNK